MWQGNEAAWIGVGGAFASAVVGALITVLWRNKQRQPEAEPNLANPVSPNGEPHWAGPLQVDPGSFKGREAQLKALAEAFKTHRAVVISGGAGYGKTRLAAEYIANANAQGYWTTAGASPTQTLSALAPLLEVATTDRNDDDIAGEVRRRLAALPSEFLWAIDNLDNLDQLNALLGGTASFHLLATTRDGRRAILPNTAYFLPIGVLDTGPAVELLCSRSFCKFNASDRAWRDTMEYIVDMVGRLPLAVEMLAVHLGDPGQDPGKLHAELLRAPSPLELTKFRDAAEGAIIPRDAGVFATIAGTLARLSGDLRQLLSPLGYLADAPVPPALLAAVAGVPEEALARLFSECGRQSVLALVDDRVRVHSLTTAAIAATNRDGALAATLEGAVVRLDSVAQNDPVALRGELAHY